MTTVSIFSTTSRYAATVAIVGGLLLGAGASRAESTASTAAPPKTERCLLLNRVRQTKAVDEKTVLFYLNQNEIYKNVLPNKCGQLRNDEPILYKSSINQLCSVDTITPLMSTGGGYMPATSCGLGSFELIDKAVADKLISDAKAARTAGN